MKPGDVLLVGFDAPPGEVTAIAPGHESASVARFPDAEADSAGANQQPATRVVAVTLAGGVGLTVDEHLDSGSLAEGVEGVGDEVDRDDL